MLVWHSLNSHDMLSNSKNQVMGEQLRLAGSMSFIAGTVNVTSFLAFYVFSSNVTGYYAILGAEIAEGNFYQIYIIFAWIFLFLSGSFISSLIVHSFKKKNRAIAISLPLIIEIACLFSVGFYGMNFYAETLTETEILVAMLLFAMGVQNGFTSSISKFAVKTTHLTGATTDFAVLLAMLTKNSYRKDPKNIAKFKLLGISILSYLTGTVFSGILYFQVHLYVLYGTCVMLTMILAYNMYKVYKYRFRQQENLYGQTI